MEVIMKKVGRILFCIVPFLLAFGIQTLISIPFLGIGGAYIVCTSKNINDVQSIVNAILKLFTSSGFNTWLSATYGVAALAVFGFWYQKRFHDADVRTVPRYFNPMILISLVAIAVGLQYVTNYVVSFTAYLRPDWMKSYENLLKTIDIAHVTPVLLLYSVIVAPICEELIFRGVTMSYAKREMPFWVANILQAVLFGIYHMNPLQGIYAFFIGLFLGYVCHKGGSIFLSMCLHSIFNLWGTLAPETFTYGSEKLFFFIFWLVFGLIVLSVGLIFYKKGLFHRDQRVNNLADPSDN
jgi:membrane protease YdiL (CAAX protease family)